MKKKYFPFLFFYLSFCLVLVSCSSFFNPKGAFSPGFVQIDTLVQKINYDLSSVIDKEFSSYKLIVTTFVDLNDMSRTCSFGRLISEKLISSLSNLGFNIQELRASPTLFMVEKKGEMFLTRNSQKIPDTIQADAVVYGTYLLLDEEVIVTARIVRASDFQILRSSEGKLLRTSKINNLLNDYTVDVYERMPMT